MKGLRGGDTVNGGPLHRYVARRRGLDEQRFSIRFYDCARQSISIFQRDLVGGVVPLFAKIEVAYAVIVSREVLRTA